jgi:hypothetical protein
MKDKDIPLSPIQLTPIGDLLEEYPTSQGVGHTTDEKKLNQCVGIHALCDSFMDLRPASTTHNAINCRGCNLRVPISNTIITYGDLRKASLGNAS